MSRVATPSNQDVFKCWSNKCYVHFWQVFTSNLEVYLRKREVRVLWSANLRIQQMEMCTEAACIWEEMRPSNFIIHLQTFDNALT